MDGDSELLSGEERVSAAYPGDHRGEDNASQHSISKIQRPLDDPNTIDPHEVVYMAVGKAGVIKAKVTMVCLPPKQ